jgi:hypothetical protein
MILSIRSDQLTYINPPSSSNIQNLRTERSPSVLSFERIKWQAFFLSEWTERTNSTKRALSFRTDRMARIFEWRDRQVSFPFERTGLHSLQTDKMARFLSFRMDRTKRALSFRTDRTAGIPSFQMASLVETYHSLRMDRLTSVFKWIQRQVFFLSKRSRLPVETHHSLQTDRLTSVHSLPTDQVAQKTFVCIF